ncbi:penicillin-binding protein 2 [Candidatus Thiosymbion oneisti]|uniref:penicillin-binding protein 2 n=1 Tax=Candidatus Thiosymbion oneisti TaxID=589554 RepID=UPI000A70B8EC|nr:penicillin-binding protein 2 [Candidatus Thiosymbion oneisti]
MVEPILKDPSAESRLFAERAVMAGVLVLVTMLVVIARLVQLQIGSHAHLSTLSRYNHVRLEPLPPTRGLIYDANGILLADNYSSRSLELTPEEIRDLDATIAELGELIDIGEADLKRFARIRKLRRRFEAVPIRTNLTEEEVARFAVTGHRFPGVVVRAQPLRIYPLGEYTAHVLSYVGRINKQELERIDASNYAGTNHIGKGGVEKAHEALLHGTAGYCQVEVNAQGRALRVLKRKPPEAGQHLQLYLDSRLQQDAHAALGDRRGAVVAIDPGTGGVLALVSRPSFDPNLFVDGISSVDYKTLRDSPHKPLFNRAIRGQYPPGSTIKPFIGLGGLETDGGVTDAKWCPGYYRLPGHRHKYRCWNRWGHGTVTLEKAIVQSCDVYFYKLAQVMGIDRLHGFLAGFGFGTRTGIDLAGELGGLLPSRAWKLSARNQPWFIGETLLVGIGQGPFLATPLQLAVATAALAARRLIRPRVVRATGAPGSAVEREFPAQVRQLPVASRNLDRMIKSMVQVVRNRRGTAKGIRTKAYSIAGKTGTVQVFSIKQKERYRESEVAEHMRDHALFVAFAPVEDPRIAVAVIVENGGHGGAVAAPVARRVMDSYLLRMPPLAAVGEIADGQ